MFYVLLCIHLRTNLKTNKNVIAKCCLISLSLEAQFQTREAIKNVLAKLLATSISLLPHNHSTFKIALGVHLIVVV